MRPSLLLPCLALFILVALGAGGALASRGTDLVTVASGGTGKQRWDVGIGSNRDGDPCVRIAGGIGSLITCGELPAEDWMPIGGTPAEGPRPSIDVGLTSPRVRLLRLLIGHPGIGRKPTSRSFSPALLTLRQAREARLPRSFRYVVITEPSDSCVEGVKGLDRRGHVVIDERVPCDY